MSCYPWSEPWGQDIHSQDDGGDLLYGTAHREIAVGHSLPELGVVAGYEVDEHLWDDATGWC